MWVVCVAQPLLAVRLFWLCRGVCDCQSKTAQAGVPVLLFRSARPGPRSRYGSEPRFHRIVFNVSNDLLTFHRRSYPVVKGLTLPKGLACSLKNAICTLRAHALDATCYPPEWQSWLDEQMNMIRHDDVSKQPVLAQFVGASKNARFNLLCYFSIAQPQGAKPSLVQKLLRPGELSA